MNSFTSPEWVHHAIIYQIFPDRFAKSKKMLKPNGLERWDSEPTVHGYKGGDLLGVLEKLDYLQDLGVNTLYFNQSFSLPATIVITPMITSRLIRCWEGTKLLRNC